MATTASTAQLGRSCRQSFRVLPYLTMVTSSSIRINLIPDGAFDVRASLSPANQSAWGVTAISSVVTTVAGTRTHFVAAPNPTFTGLTAGTQYKYQVECRTNSTSPWQLVNRAYFKTLPTSGAAVQRVAITADSHTTQEWLQDYCRTGAYAREFDKTISNMGTWGAEYWVDLGDTTNIDFAQATCNAVWRRESGGTFTFTANQGSLSQADADARWEVFLSLWQPVMAYLPLFETPGNHEPIVGWGPAGAGITCGVGQNRATFALTAMQNALGNYNDAFPNGSDATDYDGDGSLENQNDGLYFEVGSGSMRWFFTESNRYNADLGLAGAVPASVFPGFVARTSDAPLASFAGTISSSTWPDNGTDTSEDNATMGATQEAWFVARAVAKTEAFGAVVSHRPVGGVCTTPCYCYQRGARALGDTNGNGVIDEADNFDTDRDGDVSDESYIFDEQVAHAIQIRLLGHDHLTNICRKSGIHYVEIGRPKLCTLSDDAGLQDGDQGCLLDFSTTNPTGVDAPAFLSAQKTYDCDGDGFMDAAPHNHKGSGPLSVSNGGITGATGTSNPGFGLLTIDGGNTMELDWVVTDGNDDVRNNDKVITYGPITP